ncbi:MAG: GIY-YIG nuclease family protein [Tenuifilaceae bacterium]
MNTDASYSLFIRSTAKVNGCHPQNECWSVYIFLCADNTYYTGCTSNINERIDKDEVKLLIVK